jgi:hypothetical protein
MTMEVAMVMCWTAMEKEEEEETGSATHHLTVIGDGEEGRERVEATLSMAFEDAAQTVFGQRADWSREQGLSNARAEATTKRTEQPILGRTGKM